MSGAVALALMAVACSGGVSESSIERTFGLSAGCAPVLIGDEVLVSPGELIVDEPGEVSGVRFVFAEAPPAHIVVSQGERRAALGLELSPLSPSRSGNPTR